VAIGLAALGLAGCEGLTAPLPTGLWGGTGITMEVSGTGALMEFDCAAGAITTLVSVKEGTFDVPGSFTLGHGGPIREDEIPDTREARYSGVVQGSRMTLLIRATGIDQPIGPFELRRADPGLLRRCL
jgi:hypothetical protein